MAFKKMLTASEIEEIESLTTMLMDLEAHATAMEAAPFAPIETDHGELFFARLNGRARVILGDKPLSDHNAKTRIAILNKLKQQGL
jgi:hypothetical protein